MTVYLSEYIYPPAVEKLKQHATVVDNFDHIEEIDAIILRNIPVTAEMMDRAKKLKVIAKHGIGCNTIDVAAAKARGIQVIYTPIANADSVAEMTVGLFLMLERRMYEATVNLRQLHPKISWVRKSRARLSGRLAWEILPNELPTS